MYIQNDFEAMKMIIEQHHKELREESEIRHLLRLQHSQQNSISPVTWVGHLFRGAISQLTQRGRSAKVTTGQQNYV